MKKVEQKIKEMYVGYGMFVLIHRYQCASSTSSICLWSSFALLFFTLLLSSEMLTIILVSSL